MKKRFLLSFSCNQIIMQLSNAGALFMTSFMIYLGFSDAQIGLIVSTIALTDFLQLISIAVYKRFSSRKKVIIGLRILRYAFFYSLLFIPILLNKPSYIIFFVVLIISYIARGLSGGGFIEWNDVFVESDIRGRYYSTRNILANIIVICISLSVGRLLDTYGDNINVYILIFSVALVFMAIDIINLIGIQDTKQSIDKENRLVDVIKQPFADKRYMKFVFFSLLWMFAWGFGRPYYNVYAVKHLHFNYSYVALIGSITAIIKITIAKVWGITGDKKGWKNVCIITGLGVGITNLIWLVITPTSLYLYPVLIIVNGVFVIGINIAKFNINIELCEGRSKIIYFGFNAAVMGLFSFVSTNLCTLFVQLFIKYHIKIFGIYINPYQLAFSIAGLLHIFSIYYLVKYVLDDINKDTQEEDEESE